MTKSKGIMHEATAREVARVAALLRLDRKDARADRLRADAIVELENGGYQNRDAIPIPPTPEQLAKFEYRETKGENIPGTVHSIKTMRRVPNPQIMKLYLRGVLDDDTFPACKWFRDQFERSGLDVGCSIAQMGERVAGEKLYGSMARTESQAIARDFVRAVRDKVGHHDPRLLRLFEMVVLGDVGLTEAARAARFNVDRRDSAMRTAAWECHAIALPHMNEASDAKKND